MKLNAQQRLFVKEYLKDRNATRAYMAAYGKPKGAASSASALLRNPKVALAVAKGIAQLETKLEISAERTLKRLAEFAYQPLNGKDLKSAAGVNSLRALEMIAKHFKLLTDVSEVSGKNGGPQVILTMPANNSEKVDDESLPDPKPSE